MKGYKRRNPDRVPTPRGRRYNTPPSNHEEVPHHMSRNVDDTNRCNRRRFEDNYWASIDDRRHHQNQCSHNENRYRRDNVTRDVDYSASINNNCNSSMNSWCHDHRSFSSRDDRSNVQCTRRFRDYCGNASINRHRQIQQKVRYVHNNSGRSNKSSVKSVGDRNNRYIYKSHQVKTGIKLTLKNNKVKKQKYCNIVNELKDVIKSRKSILGEDHVLAFLICRYREILKQPKEEVKDIISKVTEWSNKYGVARNKDEGPSYAEYEQMTTEDKLKSVSSRYSCDELIDQYCSLSDNENFLVVDDLETVDVEYFRNKLSTYYSVNTISNEGSMLSGGDKDDTMYEITKQQDSSAHEQNERGGAVTELQDQDQLEDYLEPNK